MYVLYSTSTIDLLLVYLAATSAPLITILFVWWKDS